MIAGGLCIAAGTFGYSAITSFALLLLFRGIQGVGYAMMSVGASTAIIDVLPRDRLGEGIGISAIASTLAESIAPSVGLAIVMQFDFNTVFISTALVALAGILSVFFFCNYEKRWSAQRQKPEMADTGQRAVSSGEYLKSKPCCQRQYILCSPQVLLLRMFL